MDSRAWNAKGNALNWWNWVREVRIGALEKVSSEAIEEV